MVKIRLKKNNLLTMREMLIKYKETPEHCKSYIAEGLPIKYSKGKIVFDPETIEKWFSEQNGISDHSTESYYLGPLIRKAS